MNDLIGKMILDAICQGMQTPFILFSRKPIDINQYKPFISENKVLNVPDGCIYLSEKKNVTKKQLKELSLSV
jgi:hypothetical protein